ncbi:Ribonuclease P protein component 3 [Thermococcus argininiproducens]|uniref:Ribonuclease P protein component 3 n=1 Tax=Thermococcus argininiproducens TaxID=2866384 RepID=A0A9E7M902_9EURY|nr:Ribonuclease P protein component 3 [Thermococcus argininiproducens]USG99626.1 Ribonuclease P protein component 3 [Thermococcus argininiproducens]
MKFIEMDVRSKDAYELAKEWYDEVVFTKKLILKTLPNFDKLKNEVNELKKEYGKVALLIITDKPSIIREVKRRVPKALIYVQGGNLRVTRFAMESKVDAIISPEFGRRDNGLDHVLARLASRNDVAIGFSLSQLLRKSSYERSTLLKFMIQNWKLVNKYKVPRFLTSSAESKWEIRSPRDLMSFGMALGMEIPQAKASLTFYPEKIFRKIERV